MDILENYSTLGALINAEGNCLRDKSHLIESPKTFLDFCKSRHLSSFLFSMYPKNSFEEIFGSEVGESFARTFSKTWAANLRCDTIREELSSLIMTRLGTEYLFLDPSLQVRSIYGNRFLMSYRGIQILLASEPANLQVVMRGAGFSRVYPQYDALARVGRGIGLSIGAKYFKRNEFMVGVNSYVPNCTGYLLEADSLMAGRLKLDISGRPYCALSECDSLLYSVVSLLDALLLKYDYSAALVSSYLLVKREISASSGAKKAEKCRFVESILFLVQAMFEGVKDLGGEEFALREALFSLFDYDSRWSLLSDRLSRLSFYYRFSPQIKKLDLFKIMFKLRYL